MDQKDLGWGELESAVDPGRLERAVSRGAPGEARYALVDFEPEHPSTFYDEAPYDYSVTVEWKPASLLDRAIARQPDGQRRLDIGCGGGRNVPCLLRGGAALAVLDLSEVTLKLVAARHPVRAARGSLLSLPFVDESFDFVVCDGVAHLVRDAAAALAEAVRVMRPGTLFYVALYRSGTAYEAIYRSIGAALRGARKLEDMGLPKALDRAAFGAYCAASRLVKPERTTDERALRAIYEDYFLTPFASFCSRAWVEETFARLGAPVEQIEASGNVWRILARKTPR